MDKQRGGSLRVSGWLVLLVLALCVGEAMLIRHLYAHRAIEIHMSQLGSTVIAPPDDSYAVKCFPQTEDLECWTCDGFNNICSSKI